MVALTTRAAPGAWTSTSPSYTFDTLMMRGNVIKYLVDENIVWHWTFFFEKKRADESKWKRLFRSLFTIINSTLINFVLVKFPTRIAADLWIICANVVRKTRTAFLSVYEYSIWLFWGADFGFALKHLNKYVNIILYFEKYFAPLLLMCLLCWLDFNKDRQHFHFRYFVDNNLRFLLLKIHHAQLFANDFMNWIKFQETSFRFRVMRVYGNAGICVFD